MWFKNLQLFQITRELPVDLHQLHQQLEPFQTQPCKSIETYRNGWAWPAEGKTELFHTVGNSILLRLRHQEKVLPAAVIKDAVNEKAAAIEAKEGRRIGRRERLNLKEDVLAELTPKAFVRCSDIWGYIDLHLQLIVIDAASSKKAERFLDLLRQTLGSLPVIPLSTQLSPSSQMTLWLKEQSARPHGLLPDGQCELRSDLEEGSVIRCKQQEVDTSDILAHLDTGKQVVKLAIRWQDRVQCILQDDLSLKRLRFGDALLNEARESYTDESPIAQLDTDFALMSLELRQFLPALTEWLGGRISP